MQRVADVSTVSVKSQLERNENPLQNGGILILKAFRVVEIDRGKIKENLNWNGKETVFY